MAAPAVVVQALGPALMSLARATYQFQDRSAWRGLTKVANATFVQTIVVPVLAVAAVPDVRFRARPLWAART